MSVVKREVKCEEDETAIGSAKERLRGVGNCSSGIRESGLNDPAAQRLSLTLASPACLFLYSLLGWNYSAPQGEA